MLTEGWDANTVTHVLGVRAFGTQLLCEQVIGRALRRQSYDLNEDLENSMWNMPMCFGIPFDFTPSPSLRRRSRRAKPSRSSRPPRTRRARNPIPACRRLPRRTAGGKARGAVQRGFRDGTHARSRRRDHHAQFRHHRRRPLNLSSHPPKCVRIQVLFEVTSHLS
jgi:superfamily II DNA or RNA helicase